VNLVSLFLFFKENDKNRGRDMKKIISKCTLKEVSVLLIAVVVISSSTVAMANMSKEQSSSKAMWLTTGYTSIQPRQPDTLDEHWIHFDDGINNDAIGMGGGGTWEGAIRMTPGELKDYEGWKLVVVKWYHYVVEGTSETHSGNIKIYECGDLTEPGDLITSEPYTVTGEGWFEILLSNPVTIAGDEDVWVSVEVTHGGGENPLGVDVGPSVPTKGDWIYGPGTGWIEMRIMGLDYNWNIHALIVGGEDNEPPITTCILDGEMEGDVYVTDVTVTLEAIDYLSGVNYTMYKLDEGEWTEHEDSFVVSDDGEHTFYYYSVDNAGNVEEEKSCTFTIELEPDLDCDGTLSWTKVKPGATVTGSFTVENVGEPTSELDWKIESYPGWGNWTFTPSSDEDLTPDAGKVTVEVEVVAPDEQNTEFEGEVKVINSDDPSDFCIIPVTLSTPVNQQSSSSQVHQFLQKIIQTYPILEQIFSSSPLYRMLNFQ